MNRDEFFAHVKSGDRFCIYSRNGTPEPQVYTATSGACPTGDKDLRVTFNYPIEQTRSPGAIRWNRFDTETFEFVEPL